MKDFIIEMSDGSKVRLEAMSLREATLLGTSIANSSANWHVVKVYVAPCANIKVESLKEAA